MTDRRVLIVGARAWLDLKLPDQPGATPLLRAVAARLTLGGASVRCLLDDAPDDHGRPLLTNLLEGLAWLAGGPPEPLLILSGRIEGAAFLPRDARTSRLERTALPLSELAAELPESAGIIADTPAPPATFARQRWAVGAPADCDGGAPSPFLSAVAQRFAEAGPLHPADLAAAVASTGAWAVGQLEGTLLPALPAAPPRSCPSCTASVPAVSAAFCPSCGASLADGASLDGGRYRLLRQLGEGGMGEVFLAEDSRLKVRRAIKRLRLPANLPPEEAAGLRARMIQEARAAQVLGEVSHHVVQVFDVGHDGVRGEPFLVMELLEGETLAAALARGRLPLAEALRVTLCVAQTLALAHDRNLIHRDLKPENVMLVPRGETAGFVKLLDFGLVKLEHAEVHTRSGRLMGTLQYMPPEQLRGQRVDARADVYSLGAVLYECLSGVRANPGSTQQEIFAVLLDAGPRPLATVAPELPRALCALVDRCLSLDREARPADAGAVATALAAFAVEPLDATLAPSAPPLNPPRPPEDGPSGATQPPRPARWVLLGLALAGLGWWAWPAAAPPPPDSDARPDAAARSALDAGARDAETRDVGALTDRAPPPDAGRAETHPPPPAAWPADLSQVSASTTPAGLHLTGGTPAERYAAAVAWTQLEGPEPASAWAALPAPLHPWLGARVPPEALRTAADGLHLPAATLAALQSERPASLSLRGLGRLLAPADGPPRFTQGRCGRTLEGEPLLTAQWSTPGYDAGRCAARQCLTALQRALKTAATNHETLRLELSLGSPEGGADGPPRRVHCRLRP